MSHDHPTESAHGEAVLHELAPQHRRLYRAIPDVYRGYGELTKAAFADGELDRAAKELIALAIGVAEGCDGCIATHGRAAAGAGATRQQAAEAIGVAIAMRGGPGTVHGARAYEAFCEFADAVEAQDGAV